MNVLRHMRSLGLPMLPDVLSVFRLLLAIGVVLCKSVDELAAHSFVPLPFLPLLVWVVGLCV